MDKNPGQSDWTKEATTLSSNERKSRNTTVIWTLVGIIIGFSLPMLACLGFFFMFVVGLGAISAGQVGTQPDFPIHVSGPITGSALVLIEVEGQIVSGRSSSFLDPGFAASENILNQIKMAEENPDVKAIFLKVNSPGGSVVASDQIYQALKRSDKPIVVLMGDLAASGGYYISMAADYIFANPNTLTGSIGVISTFPNAEELFEKVGVEFNVFTSGESKDFGSLFREMTPEEKQYWQEIIDETHNNFINIVAEGREMDEDQVRPLADGRIFTGEDALELELVDELGYEPDAIEKAAQLAGIPGEPRVIRYSGSTSLLSLLEGVGNLQQGGLPQPILERILFPKLEFLWSP